MKKRKVKLFASIASLAMVVAVMGVGVWAATSQSVAINTTVGFQATAVSGTVSLAVEDNQTAANDKNDIVKTAMLKKADSYDHKNSAGETASFAIADYNDETGVSVLSTTTIADFEASDQVSKFDYDLKLTLEDKDGNGVLDEGAQVKYTFVITADTGYTMDYQITATNALDTVFDIAYSNAAATIALGQSATVTVTYTVKADYAQTIVDNTSLGIITVNIAKAGQLVGAGS